MESGCSPPPLDLPHSPTSVTAAAAAAAAASGWGGPPFRDDPPVGAVLVGLTAYTRGPRLIGVRGMYAARPPVVDAVAPVTTAPAAVAAPPPTRPPCGMGPSPAGPTVVGTLHGHGGRPHRLTVPPGRLSLRVWRDAVGVCGLRVRVAGTPGGGSVGLRGGAGEELLESSRRVCRITRLWGFLDADGGVADLGADAVATDNGGTPSDGEGDAAPRRGCPADGGGGARLVLSGASGTGIGGGGASDTTPCPFCGWVVGRPAGGGGLAPSAHERPGDGARAVHVLRCMDARIAARSAAGVGGAAAAAAATDAGDYPPPPGAAGGSLDGLNDDDDDGGGGGGDGVRDGAAAYGRRRPPPSSPIPFPTGGAAELRAALADARAEVRRLRGALPPAAAAAAERRRCVVCRDGDTEVVLLGCGHAVLCAACASVVVAGGRGCPLCGGGIERVARVFFES